MFEKLLMELTKRADIDKSVAFAAIDDGLQMLVYPLERGMLIGIGLEGEHAQRLDAATLLHKRAGDMARFSHWLPAQLKDGSWYVLKRLPPFEPGQPLLPQSDLETAMELLT